MKNRLALLTLVVSIGCRSAGTVTLAVTSPDPSHAGVPLYLELRDESGRRVAITSAKVATPAPLTLRLRRVLDGGRYQARWWLDLDRDGAPSSTIAGAEPTFLHMLTGTSDLTLWYPRASEVPAGARAAAIPPFCQLSECGPTHGGKACESGQLCVYYAPVWEWLCCIRSPSVIGAPAAR